jgi:hypothetical protein
LVLVPSGCEVLGIACETKEIPGILLTVTDSASGGPVAAPDVLIEVMDGSYRESFRQSVTGPGNAAGLAYERPGTYEVIVTAEGYHTWLRQGIRVRQDGCHVRRVDLTARLQRE